jgi:transglutaminase-like putative cysteine protease
MLRFPLLALPVAVSTLAAQAPRITPKGDPSVRNDTIYALAVDSADHPEETRAYLLDDGVVRYEADGRWSETYRQVVQILREDAVADVQERRFSYAPGHQKLRINWIRVVKPDGTVISAAPSHVQESDVPAAMGEPVYADQRVIRASLSGVAVGTLVDFSYTREETKPYRPGDFYDGWSVTTGLVTRRSRLIVDVPESFPLTIHEWNLNFPRRETHTNGRVTYTWATADLPRFRSEPFAADSDGVVMHLAMTGPDSWGALAAWYAGLAKDRYVLSPALRDKIHQLVGSARTRDDTVRAVHRWVAQDIRYVSITLGIGGYQPRPPAKVFETEFGDCKDKATLFVAALGDLGITAYPVLLSASGGVVRDLPSLQQLNHAIAAVVRPAGGYLYTDLTAAAVPLGLLPGGEQGEFGLVVHPDGQGEVVTLPLDSVSANRTETEITGTVDTLGYFEGWYRQRVAGSQEYDMRDGFWTPFDSTQKATFLRSMGQKVFDGAEGDSLIAFIGKDLGAEPMVAVRLRHGRAATRSGDTYILALPLGSTQPFADGAAELAALPARTLPIDAAKVIGPETAVTELRLTLPEGWKARVPTGATAVSGFGSYVATYAQEGRELLITRRVTGARGVFPPDRLSDLIGWFQAISRDDARFIVIDTPTAGGF